MADRKVYCNACPCFAPPSYGDVICGITGWQLDHTGQYEYRQDYADCPLKRIELKDGFVYTPEVTNDC